MDKNDSARPALAIAKSGVDNASLTGLSAVMEKDDSKRQLKVSDLGAIATFSLPTGWVENIQAASQLAQQSYSRDFSPEEDSFSSLSVFFSGKQISETSANNFRAVISEFPHELSAEEINSISQVLSKMADEDAFDLRSAATAVVSGRRVLIVDGAWKKSQTQFYGLMTEVGESREIQEIFFEAKMTGFMKYLSVVVDSFQTIEWKGL